MSWQRPEEHSQDITQTGAEPWMAPEAPDGTVVLGRQRWTHCTAGRSHFRRPLLRYDLATRPWLELEGPLPLPSLPDGLEPTLAEVMMPYVSRDSRKRH